MKRTRIHILLGVTGFLGVAPCALSAQATGDGTRLAAVLDSAAFHRDLMALAPVLGSGTWIGWIGRTGEPDTVGVRLLESNLPDVATDSIAALVKRTYFATEDGPGSVLTLTVAEAVATRVHRARMSRPRMVNEREIRSRLAEAARQSATGGTAVLRMWVNERGRVDRVVIHESAGWRPLDEAIAEIGRAARFSPARIDDYPMAVWVQQSLTVTVR